MQILLSRIGQVMALDEKAPEAAQRIPSFAKIGFTLFMAVLVPVYLKQYGASNFLYFCDVALFLTLATVWTESALFASMAAVGILIPQMLWCADFLAHLAGAKITGMTDYMFDPQIALFSRGLSFFHGWLPFFLLFLIARLGYDRRALPFWMATAWTLILVCYFCMPRPGALLANPKAPVNINYVFGLSDTAAQTWMPEQLWVVFLMTALPILFYFPAHLLLGKFCKSVAR